MIENASKVKELENNAMILIDLDFVFLETFGQNVIYVCFWWVEWITRLCFLRTQCFLCVFPVVGFSNTGINFDPLYPFTLLLVK